MRKGVFSRVAPYAVAICALVAAALPFADAEVADFAKVLIAGAALIAAVAQSATFIFLIALHRRTRRLSTAVLAAVFLASSVVAAGLPLAIPLGNGRNALLFLQPQTAAWLWIAWHVVFPAGVIAYAVARRREHGARAVRAPRGVVLHGDRRRASPRARSESQAACTARRFCRRWCTGSTRPAIARAARVR